MKKIEVELYEVTPEEIRALPKGTRVLAYDRYFGKHTVVRSFAEFVADPHKVYILLDKAGEKIC